MARSPQNFSIGQTATTFRQTLMTVGAGEVVSPSLVLTSASHNVIDVSVFVSNGTTDFIIESRKIPAGIGKVYEVFSLSTQKLNAGFEIKIQTTTADPINHHLSGSVIT